MASNKLTESEMIEEYGISPYSTTEKCDLCGKSFDSDTLVRTTDGPICFGCMAEFSCS